VKHRLSIVLDKRGNLGSKGSIGLLYKRGIRLGSDYDLRYQISEVHGDQEACLKGETMRELLVNKGEVDSKVTVGRGNNQVGKE